MVVVVAVGVWVEYVQFSIGGMAQPGGMQCVREVFEEALTACGLHFTRGAAIWEAYREFENAVLAGLQVHHSVSLKNTDTLSLSQSQHYLAFCEKSISTATEKRMRLI